MQIKIAIGSDHRGFELKSRLIILPEISGHLIEWHDVGAYTEERSDYPLFAQKVCTLMQQKQVDFGILLCGSGIGMAIAANRFKGIFAGLICNETIASLAKEDDNVNVLVFATDFIAYPEAVRSIGAWLQATFKKGTYTERLSMIENFKLC